MDLREYLFRKRMTIRKFAQLIGYHPNHVSRIVNERQQPSRRCAEAIEKATEGAVKLEELENKKIKTL